MNMNPTPQAVPGPAPLPAPDLGSCVQGIRQSIIEWAENHPILGRLADPITVQILALLQALADLFALFAAGKLAPSVPAAAPASAPARRTPAPRTTSRAPCARMPRAWTPSVVAPHAPSRRQIRRSPWFAAAHPGAAHASSPSAASRPTPPIFSIGAQAPAPTHAHLITISKQ